MLDSTVLGGDLAAARRLLDAGACLNGRPEDEYPPLAQAAWRGQAELVAELVARSARLTWGDSGSALGAALHGSRHCHDPEGGPTMRTVEEIPQERYARVVGLLLDAGATLPPGSEARGRAATRIAELGLEPPLELLGERPEHEGAP
jgi:hypothetical protein